MKMYIVLAILLALCTPCMAADEWSVTEPVGTRNISSIDSYIGTNNAAIDRLLSNYRENCVLYYVSAASVGITAGEVVCSNTAGTTRKFRKNTAVLTLTWADIDAGAEAASTTYYVYAVADADATTFTAKISTNATTPTGATYYKKLGEFYNNASSNILNDNTIKNYANYYALSMGTAVAKSVDTVYQALTDGFLVGYSDDDQFYIYTDTSNPPTTELIYQNNNTTTGYASGCCPIKKGNYYKITSNVGATVTAYFIPLQREV